MFSDYCAVRYSQCQITAPLIFRYCAPQQNHIQHRFPGQNKVQVFAKTYICTWPLYKR